MRLGSSASSYVAPLGAVTCGGWPGRECSAFSGACTPNRLHNSASGCHGRTSLRASPTLTAGGPLYDALPPFLAAASAAALTVAAVVELVSVLNVPSFTAPAAAAALAAVAAAAAAAPLLGRERPPPACMSPQLPRAWTSADMNRSEMTEWVFWLKKLATRCELGDLGIDLALAVGESGR